GLSGQIEVAYGMPLNEPTPEVKLEYALQPFSKSRGRSVAEFARDFARDRSKALAASATKKSKPQ
ncbi:MAG: hypothetical protein ABGZ24_12170, partial [Fuerstiella sp.]